MVWTNLLQSLFFWFVLHLTTQESLLIWTAVIYIHSCVSDHQTGEEGRIRKASEAEMECLIEQGRERAKWTVICGVLFHLRTLSVLLTSFSLGGLSSTVLPRLPTHQQFLLISHIGTLIRAYNLSLTWNEKREHMNRGLVTACWARLFYT